MITATRLSLQIVVSFHLLQVVFMTEEPGPHSEEEANNNKHNNCPENHDCFQCSGTDASRCVIKGGKSIRVSDGSTSDAARPDTSTSRHHQQPTNQSIGHRSTGILLN